MYLQSRTTDLNNAATLLSMFGIPKDASLHAVVAKSARMEVWATRFTDPGSDYCELRFFDSNNECLAKHRIDGY